MFKYLKKYWLFAILAPLFMVGEVVMDLMQPGMMSTIVDDGVLGLNNNNVGSLELVINYGIKMIGVVFIGAFFGIMSGVFANLCSQNFGNDIRKDCFKHIMSLSLEQTDKFSTGSLITRVTNDVTQVQNMVAQCIRVFVRTIMMLLGGIVCIISLDMSFATVVFTAFPVVLILVIFFIWKINPKFSILQSKLDKVNSVMQENITGMRVVKAYVKEEHEKKRFGGANDELVDTQLKVLMWLSFMTPIINVIMNIAIVVIIYVGNIKVSGGGTTPGEVMAAITYLSQVLHSVTMLAMIFQTISRGNASMKRLREVLDETPALMDGECVEGSGKLTEQSKVSVQNAGITGNYDKKKVKIEFKDVSFSYKDISDKKSEDDAILENINLTIYEGETVGILGSTGSGKTSLINLIPRFYDATEGAVYVDGINVKDYKLTTLRDKVSVALQKSELFSVSIKDNIKWGKEDATDEEVMEAATIAQARDFIEKQPEGFETMVAEKGMNLSGGQKQRVAISRAILKGADILIFDDATSALDLKTEANLYQALNAKYDNVTKIIIASRIASIRQADRIIVIDGGTIDAIGTHQELMNSSEIYRDIYTSQLKQEVE